MTPEVFICHASEDQLAADATCRSLEDRAIRCWIAPRDVPPGIDFASAVRNGIRGARIMVLVCSAAANASRLVSREADLATSSGVPILLVRIEDVPPAPALRSVVAIPWFDALTAPLPKALEPLAQTVSTLIRGLGERKLPYPHASA